MKKYSLITSLFSIWLLLVPINSYATSGITQNSREFDLSKEFVDMRAKVLGGEVRITRAWNGEAWEWNKNWTAPAKHRPTNMKRSNSVYEYTHYQDGLMHFYDQSGNQLTTQPWDVKTSKDVFWQDRDGNKITFTEPGYELTTEWYLRPSNLIIKDYSNRNDVKVNFERNAAGQIEKLKDHFGNTVVTYYWSGNNLQKLVDYSGREVSYTYNEQNQLTEVKDPLGNTWKYAYKTENSEIELSMEDPEGHIYKFRNKPGVKTSTFPNGRSVEEKVTYSGLLRYNLAITDSTGKVTEQEINDIGKLEREYINGDLNYEANFVLSDGSKDLRRLVLPVLRGDEVKVREYCGLIGQKSITVYSPIPPRGVYIPNFGKDSSYGTTFGCSTSDVRSSECKSSEIDQCGAELLALAKVRDQAIPSTRHDPLPSDFKPLYVKTKTVSDARGNKTTHEYDSSLNEIKVTYPDGTSISRTWHEKFAFPLTETNEKGIVTAYEYDAKGNLLKLIEAKGTPDERTTSYTYDEYGQVKTKTTGESVANNTELATTSYEYDQYGNITQITDPEGNITKYSDYDALGNAKTITDARASVLTGAAQYAWKNAYDAAGNLLTRRDPYDKGETYTYNKTGDIASLTSASGSMVNLTSNAIGQPLTMTDDNGKVVKIEYDRGGRLTLTTDAVGNRTQTIYDSKGNLSRTIDGEGNTTQLTYADDLLKSIQFPTYKETREHDNRNRVKQTTQQANSRNYIQKRGYDPLGNMASSTDAQDNATAYEYDALNRVKKITDAEGGVTEFTYDARDNLLQVKDPEGRLTIYTYDKNDRLLSETKDGDQNTNRQRRYAYDQYGNLISSINPEQEKTTYEFDQANRLVKTQVFANKNHAHPIKVISYNFNEKNHLTGWSQQASSTLPQGVSPTADVIPLSETYTYNNLEQLEAVAVNFGNFTKSYSYTYYPNGLKKTYTNPEGIIYTYYYNKNNQLMAVHIPGEGQISWANFDWMVPQTLLLPGGQKISLKYDDFQQLEERVLRKADNSELAKAVYEYDLAQNIKKIEKGEGIFNYNYDNLYRLTHANSPTGYAANDESFDYDAVGNRTARTENGASESQNYNQKNQLQSIDSSDNTQDATYSYNANGHTKTQTKNGVVTEYVYNHEERLIAVKRDGSTIAEYAYNLHGQRVKKDVSGIITWYFYNENGLAAEYDAIGNLIKEYHFHTQKTWMTDPLFQRTATGDLYYYHNDHLGTPQQLLDESGNIVWNAQYSAFGKAHITINTVENNLRFPGQYFDEETGLHQNFMRDYDAETGRYLQEDPLGIYSSINYYAYAAQNPLSFTDPTGEIVPVVAAYARCVLQCMAIEAAMNAWEPNPCYSPENSAKECALECVNPLNWVKPIKPNIKPKASGGSNPGRSGRQERLRQIGNDDKASSADRGWIKQEQNRIARAGRGSIRNPPGKQLAHERGREAAKGYGYEHSNLQDKDLHDLQHKYDDRGRRNHERPPKPGNESPGSGFGPNGGSGGSGAPGGKPNGRPGGGGDCCSQ